MNKKGLKTFQRRLRVPKFGEARGILLEDARGSHYSLHLGSTKLYHMLKRLYWWPRMKRKVGKYVE